MSVRFEPRRAVLGADAWAVLLARIPGVALGHPFRPTDPMPLTAEQEHAAERALRASPLVTGDSDDLVEDLDPAVQGALAALVAPDVLVEVRIGLGDDLRTRRVAVLGDAASSIARETTARDDGVEYGPVTLSALTIGDVMREVLHDLDPGSPAADRAALEIDPAEALAIARALGDERRDVAAAIAQDETVPEPLEALATGLCSVARFDVVTRSGTSVLVALATDEGWWTATLTDGVMVLEPTDRDALTTTLAGAVSRGLVAGSEAPR